MAESSAKPYELILLIGAERYGQGVKGARHAGLDRVDRAIKFTDPDSPPVANCHRPMKTN
jgi:hypothetical protein